MKSFRELECWQKAHGLEKLIYELVAPRGSRCFLKDQMERAANSVTANIAEGFGLNSDPGFMRHLNIAIGSLTELDSHLDSLKIRDSSLDVDKYSQEIETVRKSVLGLKRYIKSTP